MEIRLENLTKVFTTKRKGQVSNVVAVNNMNIEIPSGTLVGLLGPSGCGKSTTLYMLSGLQKPTEGKIFFGEEDVTSVAPEKRGIGLVFQNYALYPHMTVLQNILFPLQNMKVEKEEALARAKEAARLVQIDELLDRKPSELSGGQQQRVAIARAIANKPKILIADEPTGNLDSKTELEVMSLLKRCVKDFNQTLVMITHNEDIAKMADRVVVMKDGNLK